LLALNWVKSGLGTAAQVKPPELPDWADKKYPLVGVLDTFNFSSLTTFDWSIASVTVLLLGVPMFTVEPRTITK